MAVNTETKLKRSNAEKIEKAQDFVRQFNAMMVSNERIFSLFNGTPMLTIKLRGKGTKPSEYRQRSFIAGKRSLSIDRAYAGATGERIFVFKLWQGWEMTNMAEIECIEMKQTEAMERVDGFSEWLGELMSQMEPFGQAARELEEAVAALPPVAPERINQAKASWGSW